MWVQGFLLLGAVPFSGSAYFPDDLFLVRARTVAVGTREVAGPPPRIRIPQARFEIVHVHLGPSWLRQRTFTCDRVPYQATVTSPLARLHVQVGFEKGAEGLWWVAYDPRGSGELRPVRTAGVVDALGIRPFPFQRILHEGNRLHASAKDMEASFREGLAWAAAAEKVYRAGSDREREALLRQLAAEHSQRSAWAIACLARSGRRELVPFFRKLIAEEKRPLEAQVVLDQALSALAGKDWEGSPRKQALVCRWRETYRGPLLPLPLEVLNVQRMARHLPPLVPGYSLPAFGTRP